VEETGALCAACWRDTPFIHGLVCDRCGVPLPGGAEDEHALCDDCLRIERPWHRGRAALLYRGRARRMVLALKHGDRTELAGPAAGWMAAAARSIVQPDMLVVPVPVHWTRLVMRRYNQAALLARELARTAGLQYRPDALIRRRATPSLDGAGRAARFATLSGAISPHPRNGAELKGRGVLIVDDVMTSGATLAAAATACRQAQAARICTVTLARVAKDA